MTLLDYLRVLRKRWRLVVIFALVALGLAAAVVVHATPKYQARAELFVSANDTGDLAGELQSGAQFSQGRVQSYAEIVNTPEITDKVAAELNLGLTGTEISREITATAPTNTVLLNVEVTDTSPTRAELLANAVSNEFASYAANLEADASKSTPPIKITVVKPAGVPKSPTSPRKVHDLLLGLLAGLFLGVVAAFVLETLDNTVKTGEDVQAATGRAAIGVIGFDPEAKSHPLVIVEDTRSVRSEAFRQLRTNLQFIDVDVPLRSIVCTSSVPSEGKTTTICNLAITLASTGMRVLLVEADLRRPRVGLYMGLENVVGLTSVLIGAIGFDEAVQSWGADGLLDVLPSGPTPPNPSELLGSHGMITLLRSLEQRYDIVLLDAPPLLPVTDAAVLAVEASGALLVVHHGKTRREQLQNSTLALTAVGARILGTIINFAPRKGPEAYYYGYAYSYHSKDRPPIPSLRPATQPAPHPSGDREPARAEPEPTTPRNGAFPTPSPATIWPEAPVLPSAVDAVDTVEEPPSAPPAWASDPTDRSDEAGATPVATSSERIAQSTEDRSPWSAEHRDPAHSPAVTPTYRDLDSDARRPSFDDH